MNRFLSFQPVTRRVFRVDYRSPDVCQPETPVSSDSGSASGSVVSVLDFTNTQPAGPELTAFSFEEYIGLTWTAVPGAVSYILYRSTSESGPFTLLLEGISATEYSDIPPTTGDPYFYYVVAVEPSFGLTQPSNTATGALVDTAPAGVEGCICWLDADSLVSVGNGNAIAPGTLWLDRTDYNNDWTAVGSGLVFTSDGFDSRAAVRFDAPEPNNPGDPNSGGGTNGPRFECPDFLTGLTEMEIFLAVKLKGAPSVAAKTGLWTFGSDLLNVEHWPWYADQKIYQGWGLATREAGLTPTQSLTTDAIINISFEPDNIPLIDNYHTYINGVNQISRYRARSFNSTFRLGLSGPNTAAKSYYLDGYVAEMLVFNRALNSTERNAVYAYLTR